ncbi:DinB family protein [Arcticibacter sp. MXS-1]|uniref:DinB family protein n=1 Tax=Arcticibacter sp. MXS-1 TaxID=3341726 RepID=UPI0035A88E14
MYRTINDFISDRRDEVSHTTKVFSSVTEGLQKQKPHENIRSAERLAWHIVQTLTEMGHRAGLFEEDLLENEQPPATVREIIERYVKLNELLIENLAKVWSDSDLEVEIPMYGEMWKKGKLLSVLNAHEAHHRSQLTVVMRLLGMPVPGIYGPSKEEWAGMGMPAME